MSSTNPKDKIGRTKPPLELIPPAAMIEESIVMGLGAKKYGPYNWRGSTVSAMVYLGAALRHILQELDGEPLDPESGASHAAHARACLGIYIDSREQGTMVDDRPNKGKAAELIRKFTKVTPPVQDIRQDDGSYLPPAGDPAPAYHPDTDVDAWTHSHVKSQPVVVSKYDGDWDYAEGNASRGDGGFWRIAGGEVMFIEGGKIRPSMLALELFIDDIDSGKMTRWGGK